MKDIGICMKPLIDQDLKILWENRSKAYNSMFNRKRQITRHLL